MKKLFFLLLLLPISVFAQGQRYGEAAPVTQAYTPGGQIFSAPNAIINFCSSPANGVPCTNKVTTYTNISLSTSCPLDQQITLPGSTNCVTTTDGFGNWGVWVPAGTYAYTITLAGGQSIGPYTVTVTGGGGTGCTITGGTQNAVVTTNPSNTCNPVPVTADSSGNLIVPANSTFGGPNPYVDATHYGVRAVTSNLSNTATISLSTPTTVSLGSNYDGINGDGIVIGGAGATNSTTTPSALTFTPSQSIVNGQTRVNSGTGSMTTTYNIAIRRIGGGVTAASSTVTVSTGLPGGQQSASISGCTRSNNVESCTASGNTIATGALAHISGFTGGDLSFNGAFIVTASGTTFTMTTGEDTRNGAPTSTTTTGTVTWKQENYGTWTYTSDTSAWQYVVYRNGGGTGNVCLVTPGANWFDDFGQTCPTPPWDVPTTPPGSATNDNLITTVSSGAGSSTLTIANAATNAARGATLLFDNTAPILAAAAMAHSTTGGQLTFPAVTTAGACYITNSILNLSTFSSFNGLNIHQIGEMCPNDTIYGQENGQWKGNGGQILGGEDQFVPSTEISCGTAYPCFRSPILYNNTIEEIYFNQTANNAPVVQADASAGNAGNFVFNRNTIIAGNGGGNLYGVSLSLYGIIYTKGELDTFDPSITGNWSTTSPAVLVAQGLGADSGSGAGRLELTTPFFTASGIANCSGSSTSRGPVIINGGYEQGAIQPTVMLCGAASGTDIELKAPFNSDTNNTEVIANWAGGVSTAHISGGAYSFPSNVLTGLPFEQVVIWPGVSTSGPQDFGQNFGVIHYTTPVACNPPSPFGSSSASVPCPTAEFKENVKVTAGNTMYWENTNAPVPSAMSPSSGGSLTVASWTYLLTGIAPLTGESLGGTTTTCTTTTGNQTCSGTATLNGYTQYYAYRCLTSNGCAYPSQAGNYARTSSTPQTGTTFTDNGSVTGTTPPTYNSAGNTQIQGTAISTPSVSSLVVNGIAAVPPAAGSDMSLQIQNRLAALPTANTQAEVNARGYTTSQTISVNPFANMTTNPASIIFDAPCVNTTQNAQISETVSDFVWNGCGTGGSASLFAGASFPASTPMVSLGSSSLLRQHVDFRDTRIDCNAGTGPNTCTPLLLSNLQEFSVTERTNAVGANSSTSTGPAVEVTDPNGGGHWTMRDTAIAKSGDNDGIYLHLEGSTGGLLERTTVDNTGFNSGTNCGEMDSIDGNPTFADIIDFHCEGFTNGLQLDAHAGASAMGVDSTGTNTTLINIASGAGLFAGSFLYSSSATNLVVDASLASTLTLTRSSYPNGIGYYTNGAIFGNTIVDTGVTGSTQCAQFNSSGQLSGTGSACGSGGGGVTSVSNSDSTLTISPTTGAVVASLNLAHANTWTATQTMPSLVTSGSGSGAWATGQGADNCVTQQAAIGVNSACWEAPATVNTTYHGTFAATPSSGIPHYSYTSPAITETISAVNLGNSDVTGNLPLTNLATQAADSVLMNATGSSASPTAVAMPTTGTNGCAGATNALTYNTTSHALGCNTISGGSGGGGTVTYTASQTASTSDNGKLVVMNCSSACAYTLPATQPSTTFFVRLMSIGSTLATVGLSGDTWNGTAVTPVLNSSAPLTIYADSATSTNYAGNPSVTSFPTASQTIKSSAVGVTPLILNTPASPTVDIFDVDINGSKQFSFDSSGNMNLFGPNIQTASGSSLLIRAINQVLTLNATGGGGNGIRSGGAPYQQAVNSIAFSTTPALDLSLGNVQQFSCTTAGASVSPTFSNPFKGDSLTVIFVQNGTTACTWTWPATIHGGGTVATTLSGISVQSFIVSNNGTDAYAISPMQNMTGGTP